MPLLFPQYHRKSSNHTSGRKILPSPTPENWPKEWRTIYYKTYSGTPLVLLQKNSPPPSNFFDLVEGRGSTRGKHTMGITAQELSTILKFSCGLQDKPRGEDGLRLRAQPSAGARFPIEVYILSLKKENGISPGIYHYHAKKHALEILRIREFTDEDIGRYFTYPWSKKCSIAILATAIFERSAMKYGERAYRYALLEAGHIGQGIYLVSGALNIGVTGMGGTRDDSLHELLDIDGTQESLVYALMLSK